MQIVNKHIKYVLDTSHQGNANRIHNEMPFNTHWMTLINNVIIVYGENVEKLELLYIGGGNVK